MKNSEKCFFSDFFQDLQLVGTKRDRVGCWSSCSCLRNMWKSEKMRSLKIPKKQLLETPIWNEKVQKNAFLQSCFEILNFSEEYERCEMITSCFFFTKYVKKCKNEISVDFNETFVLRINLEWKIQRNAFFHSCLEILNLWEGNEWVKWLTSCSFSRNMSKSAKLRSLWFLKNPWLQLQLEMSNSEKCFFSVMFRDLELVRRKREGEMLTSCSFLRNMSKSAKMRSFVIFRKTLGWALIWDEKFREMLFLSHISRSWTCKHETREEWNVDILIILRNMSKSAKMRSLKIPKKQLSEQQSGMINSSECLFQSCFEILNL